MIDSDDVNQHENDEALADNVDSAAQKNDTNKKELENVIDTKENAKVIAKDGKDTNTNELGCVIGSAGNDTKENAEVIHSTQNSISANDGKDTKKKELENIIDSAESDTKENAEVIDSAQNSNAANDDLD